MGLFLLPLQFSTRSAVARLSFLRSLHSLHALCPSRRAAAVAMATNANYSDPVPQGKEVVEGCQLEHGELHNGSIKIHFVECGEPTGELVLMLHGFPNFWYVWKNQFKFLSDLGYHVIAPDLRGFNASSKPRGIANYSRASMISDVVLLIDHFGRGKPALVVGHDWGGALAWALSEDMPTRLSKLVVVNSPHPARLSNSLRSNYRQMLRSWYIFFFQLPFVPELWIKFNSYQVLRNICRNGYRRSLCEEDIQRHLEAYSDPEAVHASLNLYRAGFSNYWSSPYSGTKITIPVTVIWGEPDKFLLSELAEPPKELVSKASVLWVPEASHWPMWDMPDLFNSLLQQSLIDN
ncbi:hypothetical protein O6H91_16G077200 [Diphasiastrum complanatum]|uniref:Uncharacterized protein n=2 Tax=Diphasiastrum complanatum TaxID=34168 RepID=A0ACC2BDQ4_DIPCM|nr:hypothetical protein O6H91_16G076700 [Diphasiastrum complanatum]KAJ7527945.1 hypothetical protein O6H91_16G077200 [Diphasiastrum complanatum]